MINEVITGVLVDAIAVAGNYSPRLPRRWLAGGGATIWRSLDGLTPTV